MNNNATRFDTTVLPPHTCDNCGEWVEGNILHLCPNNTTQLVWSNLIATAAFTAPSYWRIENSGRELARMDENGNITFAEGLTLDEAKEAIKIAFKAIARKG